MGLSQEPHQDQCADAGTHIPRSPEPRRVRMDRRKGVWATGDTVWVGPGSVWRNPYRLDDNNKPYSRHPWGSVERAQGCVDHYRRSAEEGFVTVPYTHRSPEERGDGKHSFGAHRPNEVAAKYLRGKNLACDCPLDRPCHADVLLEWANGAARDMGSRVAAPVVDGGPGMPTNTSLSPEEGEQP